MFVESPHGSTVVTEGRDGSIEKDTKFIEKDQKIIKPLRFGFAFGAAFFTRGDAIGGGTSSTDWVFVRNGSTVVDAFSSFDGWNQSLLAVVEPTSDWEANGSTVWNGSTSIVGEEEVATGTTGNEEELSSEIWLFKSFEDDGLVLLNCSKLAENN